MSRVEDYLLGRAVAATKGDLVLLLRDVGWTAHTDTGRFYRGHGPTLTDALLALLAELGEPVELPSAEDLRLAFGSSSVIPRSAFRHADPLLVAAVLDAGGGA